MKRITFTATVEEAARCVCAEAPRSNRGLVNYPKSIHIGDSWLTEAGCKLYPHRLIDAREDLFEWVLGGYRPDGGDVIADLLLIWPDRDLQFVRR